MEYKQEGKRSNEELDRSVRGVKSRTLAWKTTLPSSCILGFADQANDLEVRGKKTDTGGEIRSSCVEECFWFALGDTEALNRRALRGYREA